ncbi:MAG: hypothetical protein QUS11_09355 [Candidatus Fermentibacter sp.]|nr:hypothetical protein [Candidatus Fermentibacter sp.]
MRAVFGVVVGEGGELRPCKPAEATATSWGEVVQREGDEVVVDGADGGRYRLPARFVCRLRRV